MDCEKSATNCTACATDYDYTFNNDTLMGVCTKEEDKSNSLLNNGWVWVGAALFIAIVVLGIAFMLKSNSSSSKGREYQLSGDERGKDMMS